jgi:acylphosphatase
MTRGYVTRRYVISGAVQGVGFRWFVARHARTLSLTGFARNLPDGTVEVVASGVDEGALARLEELLRAGPANARVARVDQEDGTDTRTPPASFDVL